MPTINGKEVKQNILKFLNEKGPSLPVPIAKRLGINTIFTSAFLSELAAEGAVKISHMKIGSSPLYFTPETNPQLENFSSHLNPKEREAFVLLKENGILEDITQLPAIRIALRGMKDFAVAFKKDEKLFWRYFLFSETQVREKMEKQTLPEKNSAPEVKEIIPPKETSELIKAPEIVLEKPAQLIIEPQKETPELSSLNKELEEKRKELEKINQEIKDRIKPAKKPVLKEVKLKKEKPIDETFLNEIKNLLSRKNAELLNILEFDKKRVIAKIKLNNEEKLLSAFNKKKLEDEDIIKTSKLAAAHNLQYVIFLKGEISKKTKEAIEAYKKLSAIERIEQSTIRFKKT